ncbi:MAG: polyphenol oxidase family protein [Egibacteraceae bacterium]
MPSAEFFTDVVGESRVSWLFAGRAEGNASLDVGTGGMRGRGAALAQLGLQSGDAVFMEQVHGGRAARVGRADRGRGAAGRASAIAGVDALVTTDSSVALTVLTADCVPVLLLAPGRGVGAVHAGRRGVQAAVVVTAVAALTRATGSCASRLSALIGPAIGGCCYEVPAALADEVTAVVPAAAATTRWGTPSLDLATAVESQLRDCGVEMVTRADACTRCGSQRWFSHRATADGAPEGRNASVIVRREMT